MASISISTPANQDARIMAAFGAYLGLGRPATGPEVKQAVIDFIKGAVRNYERRTAAITDVDPT